MGIKKYVRIMLVKKRWSPFIKAYKKRSILSGAIQGQQRTVCRMILNEYEYGYEKTFSGKAPKWVKKSTEDMLKVFGKDCDDNNILHHCYMYDMPGVR